VFIRFRFFIQAKRNAPRKATADEEGDTAAPYGELHGASAGRTMPHIPKIMFS
jgi:hypothetical protein